MNIFIVIICFLAVFLFGINCVKTSSSTVSQKNEVVKTESNISLPAKPVESENYNSSNILFSNKSLQTERIKAVSNGIEILETPRYDVRMLMKAEYYEEEVADKAGFYKGWLGLYRKENKYFLLPTTIEVKAARHSLGDDENSKEKTGKTVSTNVKLPNVFFLKNAKTLKQGEVQTVFYGNEENSDSISRVYRREFEFNGAKYSLFVEDSGKEEGDHLTKDSRMMLSAGNQKQTIYKPEGCSDCSWDLCWVGDLDKDGKLDFMLNLTSHYNSTCHTLFLSSQAKKGEIVRDVADLCQQGC